MSHPGEVVFREASGADALALLNLKLELDRESEFMLLEPGERSTTPETEAAQLERIATTPNAVVVLAETDGQLVGYVQAIGGAARRSRRTAHVVIGIRQTHASRGIGRRLMSCLDRWSGRVGVSRLELTVMAHNDHARRLYDGCGYEVEGIRRCALEVLGDFIDEIWMAKLID